MEKHDKEVLGRSWRRQPKTNQVRQKLARIPGTVLRETESCLYRTTAVCWGLLLFKRLQLIWYSSHQEECLCLLSLGAGGPDCFNQYGTRWLLRWAGNSRIASIWFCWDVCSEGGQLPIKNSDDSGTVPLERPCVDALVSQLGSISGHPCDKPSWTSCPVELANNCDSSRHLTNYLRNAKWDPSSQALRISVPRIICLTAKLTRTMMIHGPTRDLGTNIIN